jgi:hypothetical protein
VTDLLLALVAVPLLVALGLAALSAVTVVPFVLSLRTAEARGFSEARWGALALAASVVGALLALVVLLSDAPTWGVLPPLVLAWAGPVALWATSGSERIGGRAGAHEG